MFILYSKNSMLNYVMLCYILYIEYRSTDIYKQRHQVSKRCIARVTRIDDLLSVLCWLAPGQGVLLTYQALPLAVSLPA